MSPSPLPRLPRGRALLRILLPLMLVPTLTFAWSLQNDFVEWDDPGLITENPISHGLTWENMKASFTTYDPELYIPHTFFTYQVDYAVGGLNPLVYHVHNLLFHLLNVLLVAWMVYLLTGSVTATLFCALLFSVHPLQVESVVWASARKDLLSTTWFLGAIIAYLYAQERKKTWIWGISLASFALGLLSKVMIATLPAILLLIEWREGRLSWKKTPIVLLPYVLLSILFGIIALVGKKAFVAAAGPFDAVLVAGKAVIFLLWKFLVPTGLSVLYPYTDPVTFMSPALAGCLLAVVLLTVAAVLAARKGHRDILFGWLWFLVCLSPTFLLYRKGEHLGDIYVTSDRYFYAASIGIIFPAALFFVWLVKRGRFRTPAYIGTGIILAACAVLSIAQSTVWRDTDTLFAHVLKLYPNSHIAHLTVGNHYQRLGDYERAFIEYEAALRIRPTSLTYFNLGKALLQLGKVDDSIDANTLALKLDPALAIAEINLGVGYVKKQMFNEAAEAFGRAVTLSPDSLEAHFNLGAMEEKRGHREEAIREYERALELDPTLLQARHRLDALR